MVRRSTPAKVLDERRFPVRVRITTPPQGFGKQLDAMHHWLEQHAGRGNYAAHGYSEAGAPEGSLWYFLDVATAHAFIARFPCGHMLEEVRK